MQFTKQAKIFLSVLVVSVFVLTVPVSAADEIKIGVLTPLTAGAHQLGKEAVRGAEMAAEYINAKGGVLGRKVEVIVEDDSGQVEKAPGQTRL